MQKLKKSYFIGEGNGQLLYETIGSCFERVAKGNPDGHAIIVKHQGIRWSYQELYEQVDRLSVGLLALGLKPGDRVGIWGPSSIEWVMTQLATARIGAIMVCINPAYRLYELEYALNKASCKAIITAEKFKSSDYLTMLNELAPELKHSQAGTLKSAKLPHLELVIRMGTQESAGMLNFDDVCSLGGESERQRLECLHVELRPDDAINIQFTSGTTGQPKGATLSHCNILNNGWNSAQGMQLTERDKLCIPVPLYHCFGMVLGVLACVTSGATMVFPGEAFDAESTLATVEEEKCTGLHGVPTMFVTQLDSPGFNKYDVSTLRTGIIAGAPCAEELMNRIIGDLNMSSVVIGYGQTEVSPINHMTLPDDTLENRTQTVGRAIPYVEIKIVDEHDRVLAIGEQGEICTRGYSVMKGYWDDEQRTNETIIDGWLHSGDLATMDEFGYVKITGRIKDMLIRGGENIYPREIEDFLYTHPKISEAQVFGVPDEKMGEEVCVWIQLKDGQSATDQEIRKFCEGQITHFKIPRYIRFVKEFPMTVTGKIRKIEMRETMSAELKEVVS
jgi:fatty-acyl-CoA synthase|tara:strand:- start:353 stop:2035 length:1683 start_codon:yes stop_codon:yes gene_type:complete